MKLKHALLPIFTIALMWSCGKDDSPTTPPGTVDENSVPVIASKTFTVAETISDTEVIGKVTATDADDDALTFSIATNSDNLFEITAAGDLSLASGKTLDAATKDQHVISVKVDDGEDTASASVTIKVTAVAPTNQAPEMADQEFMAAEDITEANEIGQVLATDADEDDTLTFELTTNDNDLFMLSESGILTLAEGKSLDYETTTSHSITVSVTDGEEIVEATVTITVENVIESLAEDPASFVITYEITTEFLSMLLVDGYNYDFSIDWGDGTVEQYINPDVVDHNYQNNGNYTVAIKGEYPVYRVPGIQSFNTLIVEQWGTIAWKSFYTTFANCTKLEINATDIPDLSSVTSMSHMFRDSSFNRDISNWDTSNITDMSYMFLGVTSFDHDLGGWDIGNVENMSNMFDNSGMSPLNFSNTLIGWADQELQPNVTLGAEGLHICVTDADGIGAVSTLTNEPFNWELVWDGVKACN